MRIGIFLCAAGIAATGAAAAPAALADVGVRIEIGVPPPAPRIEVVPAPRAGYVWAPGYWAWNGHRHTWVSGRWIVARRGYHWVPEHWERHDGRWLYAQGRWRRAETRPRSPLTAQRVSRS